MRSIMHQMTAHLFVFFSVYKPRSNSHANQDSSQRDRINGYHIKYLLIF